MKYLYVVAKDLNSGLNSNPKKSIGSYRLDDENVFPKRSLLIASPEERQRWRKGDTINLFLPEKDQGGKTTYVISSMEVVSLRKLLFTF